MCIDLNKNEDRKMLKDIIAEVTSPLLTDIKFNLNNLTTEVDYIKKQTTETNGKVKKHEVLLNELRKEDEIHAIKHEYDNEARILTCPHTKTINELNERRTFGIKTKQLVSAILGIILLVLSITFTAIKINDSFTTSKEKEQIEQIEKIIKMLQENETNNQL